MRRNALSLTLLVLGFASQANAQAPLATVITGAQIADGSGTRLRKASVRIVGDRIARIGSFKPQKGDRVIDAKGLVLAPGFIDIHNHSAEGLDQDALAETQISQGITTVILGPDGGSPWPIGEWLEKRRKNPAALNLAVLVGHATVRKQVMGDDYKRAATGAEIEKMAALVDQAMREGALGLSSGLEYEVGSYSATDELVALAQAAVKHNGFYMTHIRDEADKAFDALNEEISIGERARIPVEHSHIKLGTVGVWGKAAAYIKIVEDARRRGVDFLADCYPYDAWHSNLKVLVPDKQYEDPKSVGRALADVGGAAHVTITDFSPHPDYEGKTIEALARERGISPVEMYIQLIRESDAAHAEPGVIGQSMIESDIKAFYQQPWVMVASDGGIGMKHPRGAGTFPRVLGRFVREKRWLTLPEAIRKMTSLPAQRLGWKDRGVLREGAVADLVLFNPKTVLDRSTFEKPFELSVGIEKVFVNGSLVWDSGQPTGSRPGVVLTRTGPNAARERVSFPTQDGGLIYADLYGNNDRGVVLAHGGRFSKESWEKQARELVKAGFRVLAIDFRGYGQSRGPGQSDPLSAPLHFDVLAAVRYLRSAGARTVSVVGASMGGAAAADASIEAEPGEIDRLVLLGAEAGTGRVGPPEKLKGRKLFIVSRDDTRGDGVVRLDRIRQQYEKTPDPKELVVLDGSAHAQFLFETDQGERLLREILRFLSATSGFTSSLVREEQQIVVDDIREVWRLQWKSPPKSACGPEPDSLSCPCSGFAYGESGQLDLVRIVDGREVDRLELTPLFEKVFADQDGAIVQRWDVHDTDLNEPHTEEFAARVGTRPIVEIMHFADYDHDGKSTEFFLQTDTEPCGKVTGMVIGLSQRNARLHAFGTALHPDKPLVMHKTAWQALIGSHGPIDVLDWPCGDHGSEIEARLELRAGNKGIRVIRREFKCTETGARGRLLSERIM